MKRIHLLATLLLLPLTTQAYWYTAVDSLTPVAVAPDTNEVWNSVLPYPDGQTLVVLDKGYVGNSYQIIDRFGMLKYSDSQPLTPGYIAGGASAAKLFPDGQGGAVIGWKQTGRGLIAQRLDSLGNLMWGDMGVTVWSGVFTSFDVCPDESGGFITIIESSIAPADDENIWAQRVDAEGNLLWGSPGAPIHLDPSSVHTLRVCSDNGGGCFAIWASNLLSSDIQLFMQHVDANGQAVWPEDLYVTSGQPYTHDLFPDGYGGVIMFVGGIDWNWAYRYDAEGQQVWVRDHVSRTGKMVSGEPGFWYIGFTANNINEQVHAQRIDVNGNLYWPPFFPEFGALMWERPDWVPSQSRTFAFRDGKFAALFTCHLQSVYDQYFLVQALDTLGNQVIDPDAALIYVTYVEEYLDVGEYISVIPAYDGLTAIIDVDSSTGGDNVYAKHLYWDGSLGGPIPFEVTLTPETLPIQIPASGGSFQYDVAIADTTPVSSSFDAWIEVTLPNGSTLEILSREDLSIEPGETISRLEVIQNVPGGAPAGNYTYQLIIGQHDVQYSWVEDSFTFSKIGLGNYPVNDGGQDESALNPPLPPLNKGDKMQHPPYQAVS